MNLAIIQGNVANVELKSTANGLTVLQFSVATHEKSKEKESTTWHNIVVFGKGADGLSKVIERAKSVLVRGKIQTRSWDKKDGSKGYTTEIIADSYHGVQITGWKDDEISKPELAKQKELKQSKSVRDATFSLDNYGNDFSDIPF